VLIGITGALAGVFHVLSGPDHLAAVIPLALADGRRGWLVGWTWGVGHASGVVCVAFVAILLREQLPPIDVISAWSERLVGSVLIAIGLWALRRSMRLQVTSHAHGLVAHRHPYVQTGPAWLRRIGHAHASFYMGILHGLAGSSHFLGVLPALALPTKNAAFVYLGAFGIGTVLAMTGFAAAIGAAGLVGRRRVFVHQAMMQTAAILAIGVGGWWLLV
jgi:hypothetical protein